MRDVSRRHRRAGAIAAGPDRPLSAVIDEPVRPAQMVDDELSAAAPDDLRAVLIKIRADGAH